jgi:hypothetical protein
VAIPIRLEPAIRTPWNPRSTSRGTGDHDAVESAITMGQNPVITMVVQVITMPWNE